jgi:hypothetical protein
MWDALPSLSRVGRSHPLRQPICTIETQVLKQLLRDLFTWADEQCVTLYFDILPDISADNGGIGYEQVPSGKYTRWPTEMD